MPDGNQMGQGRRFSNRKRGEFGAGTRLGEFIGPEEGYLYDEVNSPVWPPPNGGGYKGNSNGYLNERATPPAWVQANASRPKRGSPGPD